MARRSTVPFGCTTVALMSARGYRITIGLLAIALLVSLGLLLQRQMQLARLRSDIRLGRDVAQSLRDRRDLALKRGPTEAAEALYSLQIAPFPEPSWNPVAGFVESERRRCIADLIAFLRTRTGKDLGESPDPWIFEFGDDTVRRCQTNLVESR